MSEETAVPQVDYNEIFNASFFAALTGISSRVGQDPGGMINEAYVLAERAVERFRSGSPVLTEAQREIESKKRTDQLLAAQLAAAGAGNSPGVIMGGGHFQRPVAP